MTTSRKRLEEIAYGVMPARLLLTAVELDVFTAIGTGEKSAEELAALVGAAAGPLARLLNALVALKVLRKRKDRYRNTPDALTHLTADAPEFLGDIMLHRSTMWDSWSRLTPIVRTGRVRKRRRRRTEDERRFIKGMGNIGVFSAADTAKALRPHLRSARRLLDVGGGPAVYACEFAARNPALQVTVLDLPGPLVYAKETISRYGMRGRVKVRAGDALKIPSFGRGYDVVFFSNVIHCFKRRGARSVVRKAAAALTPGGALIIKDFYIRKGGTAPPFAALFSINMLAAGAGDCYSRDEVESWMAAAGVTPTGYADVAEFSCVIIGEKQT